jgi:hypothetical protein
MDIGLFGDAKKRWIRRNEGVELYSTSLRSVVFIRILTAFLDALRLKEPVWSRTASGSGKLTSKR